jgi:hypothetical protein
MANITSRKHKEIGVRITGISLPYKVIKSIDDQRGDISRSKFILRIIEKVLPSEVSSFSQKVVALGGDQ